VRAGDRCVIGSDIVRFAGVAALVACMACSEAAGPTGAAPSSCRVPGIGGLVRCETVEVPEDPAAPARTIGLRVVVIPAREAPASDAVVLLAGGPGQAASEVFAPLVAQLRSVGRRRDLVLVDQRGTGGSNPLQCPKGEEDLSAELSIDIDAERLIACATALDVDPSLYGTAAAVADLDAVREALGYEAFDLVGGSYGTRVALEYLRAHPTRVRAAVLDGVVPLGMKLPLSFARDGQDALDAMASDCVADEGCAAAFGDPAAIFAEVLDAAPLHTMIAHPRTGVATSVQLERETIAAATRAMLYSADLTALLPLALHRAREGDLAPLVGQLLAVSDGMSSSSYEGMYLSVICAEDVRLIEDEEIDSAVAGTVFGRGMVDVLRRSCAVWPTTRPVEVPSSPIAADAPVLVLSGQLDPATGPRWGERVTQELRAEHVVVPGAAHGTLGHRCIAPVVEAFLETADLGALDLSCVESATRPPFFVDPSGPPA
jgi:pimeloyl-ACP methyl ester carboxylesterase